MPHDSPSAADIPTNIRDPEGLWTAFGGRARVILVNTSLVEPADFPTRYEDFLDDRYPADQIGMAYRSLERQLPMPLLSMPMRVPTLRRPFSRPCRTEASASSMAMVSCVIWWLMAS
jgi:hypothetical protein